MVDLATFDPQWDVMDPSVVVSLKVDTLTGDLTIVDPIEMVYLQNCCVVEHFLVLFSGDMLDLLKWRIHLDRILDCLSKLKDIDGTEIVKV